MRRQDGCIWIVAALLVIGGSAGGAWGITHVRIATGAALLILAGGAGMFLVGVGIMKRDSRRERARDMAEYRRWLVWKNGKPDPGDMKYTDWNQGGAARFNRDMQRYIRQYGPEPGTGGNDGR